MSEWISVKDRLPEKSQAVLAFSRDKVQQIAELRDDISGMHRYKWDCDTYDLESDWVTHWMPLPDPPEAS